MPAVRIRVLLVLLLAGLPGVAQEGTPERIEIPFAGWAAEGERADMKWTAKVSRPTLLFNQRQAVTILLSIPMKGLQKRAVARELHTLIRLQDAAGRWLPEEAYEVQVLKDRLPSKTRMEQRFVMFLRPGRYAVHAFLFERLGEERNYARFEVLVPQLKSDPLPGIGRDLPAVDFVQWSEHSGAPHPLRGRLYLPLNARRPARVEIIVNFSSRPSRYGRTHRNNTQALLEILSVLAQMEWPQHSSVRLTALDVLGRRVLFQLEDVSLLDVPQLRQFLEEELNPHTVDIDTLARRLESAEFFRTHMEHALQARSSMHSAGLRGGGEAAAGTERVFLLLGAPTYFPYRTPVRRLELKDGCGCRFFYLRRSGFRDDFGVWDQLERILDPVDPHVFEIAEPKDLRKAIAGIIRELER